MEGYCGPDCKYKKGKDRDPEVYCPIPMLEVCPGPDNCRHISTIEGLEADVAEINEELELAPAA